MKKLGRNTFLAERDGRKIIMKMEPPPPSSIVRRILRRVTGGSLPFANELAINHYMHDVDFQGFRFPRLIANPSAREAIMEYVDSSEDRNLSEAELEKLLEGVFCYSQLCIPRRRSLIREGLFQALNAPLLLTTRRLLKSRLGAKATIMSLVSLWTGYFDVRESAAFLLHNDLVIGNVLRTQEGELLLIDFEDSIRDRAFFLADCVDLAFSLDNLSLKKGVVTSYFNRLVTLGLVRRDVNFLTAVRICMIRNCAHRLVSSKLSDSEKRNIGVFLRQTILQKDEFEKWLNKYQ